MSLYLSLTIDISYKDKPCIWWNHASLPRRTDDCRDLAGTTLFQEDVCLFILARNASVTRSANIYMCFWRFKTWSNKQTVTQTRNNYTYPSGDREMVWCQLQFCPPAETRKLICSNMKVARMSISHHAFHKFSESLTFREFCDCWRSCISLGNLMGHTSEQQLSFLAHLA